MTTNNQHTMAYSIQQHCWTVNLSIRNQENYVQQRLTTIAANRQQPTWLHNNSKRLVLQPTEINRQKPIASNDCSILIREIFVLFSFQTK